MLVVCPVDSWFAKDSNVITTGLRDTSAARRTPAASGRRRARRFRLALLGTVLTVGATTAQMAFAAAPVSIGRQLSVAQGNDAAAPASETPARPGSSDVAVRKSYVIPALEIVSFEILLNVVDRSFMGSDYNVNFSTIKRNLVHRSWVVDNDP